MAELELILGSFWQGGAASGLLMRILGVREFEELARHLPTSKNNLPNKLSMLSLSLYHQLYLWPPLRKSWIPSGPCCKPLPIRTGSSEGQGQSSGILSGEGILPPWPIADHSSVRCSPINANCLETFPRVFTASWNRGGRGRRPGTSWSKHVPSLSFRPGLWRWQAWISGFTRLKKTFLNINGKFWFCPRYYTKELVPNSEVHREDS